ncbi:AAA family ATPase, partial [Streptomyces sp. NPDC002812]|uniref:AAA family ATPase n=1 Tax=Streptomyces sp. NPDC002812 TaxID=3154434 RepID=UPI00332FA944
MHRGLSPVLALEERVTWAAVLAEAGLGDLVGHTVDELMEPVLRAAVENPARHEGLRRWFTGAWQRLPERVRSSRSTTRLARVLYVGAGPGMGRGAGRGAGSRTLASPDRGRWPTSESFVLAVRHDGSHITVGDVGWPATAIKVPDGLNLVLDVSEDPTRWERVARITLRRGATVSVPVRHVPVYVRTEAGVIYALGAPHDSAGWEYGLPQADATAGLTRARVSQLTDFHAVPYGVRPPATVGIPAVHTAVSLSPLPPYLPRRADEQLASAMAEVTAAEGRGVRFVLLTGAPMSGRTRTLWEAMRRSLSARWVLCPPRGTSAPDLAAMLRVDPLASPAVLWLDALDTRLTAESGEDLAQSLTELLDDPATGDVLVLATAGTDPSALGSRARSLFARATTVPLSAAFTKSELASLVDLEERRPRADPRISEAVRRHRHGRIAQYLSGLDRSSTEGPGLQWPGARWRATPVVDMLPSVGLFTGRQAEIAALLERLDPASDRRQDPVVAVTGLPGVGKTRLAVAVAREARARGLYPGGVLFADLNGYTPGQSPSPTERVMNLLLRTLGVEPAEIP